MKESTQKKICRQCGKVILRPYGLSILQWKKKKYCSNKCTSTERKLSKESRKKISDSLQGNVPWNRGESPYAAGHYRVKKERGQPNLCVMCGTKKAKRFDWANVTRDYLNIFDYIRLCRSCHCKFDKTINNLKI